MGMRKLLLIRHAQPEITPGIPARLWSLSPGGRASAERLAQHIAADYQPVAMFASPEDKASETARIIARPLGLPVETIPDLREHERSHTPFLSSDSWEATLIAFFTRPTELILGEETANQSLQRFRAAIDSLLATHSQGDLAAITHGTVLTLFVAYHNLQIDALAFWHALRLPDLVVLELPGFRLRGMIRFPAYMAFSSAALHAIMKSTYRHIFFIGIGRR